MEYNGFRSIPGYDNYGVNEEGVIISLVGNKTLSQYLLNGYAIVDTFRGSLTETLPVHRAVALAWIPNPDNLEVVNHKDGNRLNNLRSNLEWTTFSGNNYHAVDTGLRNDNIRCKIRNFDTGEVKHFSSMGQASRYMNLPGNAILHALLLKKFGSLIKDSYEFRYEADPTPWFYESRSEKITPSRYMMVVTHSDGTVRELFSNRNVLKAYQLYDSPYGKSIYGLARHGNEKYSDLSFVVRDSYIEEQFRVKGAANIRSAVVIFAHKGEDTIQFSSLRNTARYFNVDRKSITARLKNGKDLGGWTFTELAYPSVMMD